MSAYVDSQCTATELSESAAATQSRIFGYLKIAATLSEYRKMSPVLSNGNLIKQQKGLLLLKNVLLGRYRPKSFKRDFSDYAAFFV